MNKTPGGDVEAKVDYAKMEKVTRLVYRVAVEWK
jgi:hypothetical protein